MKQTNHYFEKSLEFIFKWEGEISNDPNDPGGLTVFGLSSRYFPVEQWVKAGLSKEEMKRKAKEIYYENFWTKCGEGLNFPLCLFVFDTAVQFSCHKAAKLLQTVINEIFDRLIGYEQIKVDGIIGPKTKEAAARCFIDAYYTLHYKYLIKRIQEYLELSHFKHFGRGWIRRVIDLSNYI